MLSKGDVCERVNTKKYVSKATLYVIPALVLAVPRIGRESFLKKKDCRQAAMTEIIMGMSFYL